LSIDELRTFMHTLAGRAIRGPLGALIAGGLIAALITGCTVAQGTTTPSASAPSTSQSTTSQATPAPASSIPLFKTLSTPAAMTSVAPKPKPKPTPTGAPVHIKLFGSDGDSYGVGMPIIAYFSKKISNAAAFAKATKVTVNGKPVQGAWYFEASAQMSGYPIEAHYRLATYWPGHARIHLALTTQGVSAGPGLLFDDSLTLDWTTGRADLLSVDGSKEQLTVMTDGKLYGRFPTSLGAPNTPTMMGTKVVMEKDPNERMIGPGYDEIVPWSLRLTNSGEFLHAAAWNVRNIGHRSTSNGCTNLLPADAQRLFTYLQIGDPVTYTNVAGKVMPTWDGYGDWNVPWATWRSGGLVSTV
jgi:lipoprotein-anchoring transpeptidase ErfK/SrfK